MITDFQAKLLNGILTSDYRGGETPEEMVKGCVGVWTWSACDGIPESSRGGVVSSALQAGLIGQIDDGDEACVWILQAGLDGLRAYEAAHVNDEQDEVAVAAPSVDEDARFTKFASKNIKIDDNAVVIVSIYLDGSFIVVTSGHDATGTDVESTKASVAANLPFTGPRRALIGKWITLLAREWAAWRLAQP